MLCGLPLLALRLLFFAVVALFFAFVAFSLLFDVEFAFDIGSDVAMKGDVEAVFDINQRR